MRYRTVPRFDRTLARLDAVRKDRVKRAIERLVAAFETGQLPAGVGLKCLRANLWELRAGLGDRVVFHRTGDVIELLLVGNHDDIRRFLKEV